MPDANVASSRNCFTRLRAQKASFTRSDCLTRERASTLLEERQLILLGDVLRAPDTNPIRYLSFTPGTGTSQPSVEKYVRRVDRPRREWVPSVLGRAHQLVNGRGSLIDMCCSKPGWKSFVKESLRQ